MTSQMTDPIPVEPAFRKMLEERVGDMIESAAQSLSDSEHWSEARKLDRALLAGLEAILKQIQDGAEAVRIPLTTIGDKQNVACYVFDDLTDPDARDVFDLRETSLTERLENLEVAAGLVRFVNGLQEVAQLDVDCNGSTSPTAEECGVGAIMQIRL